MYTCSHLYYVYGKFQLWLQTQWPSSIAGCSIVSLFAKWNNSMISDISPLITQGLQLASMSAPFTDGYDEVLFIAKYLQSIDEHCACKLALVHHCIVKCMFDEHCRGPQTIISTLPSIWTFVERCVLAHIHNSNASYSVCDHLNEGGGGSGQGWVRYNVGVLRC